jgi:hypothetical protein
MGVRRAKVFCFRTLAAIVAVSELLYCEPTYHNDSISHASLFALMDHRVLTNRGACQFLYDQSRIYRVS